MERPAPNGAWFEVLAQSDSGAWGLRDAHLLICDEFCQWPDTRGARAVIIRIVLWWSAFTVITGGGVNYVSVLVASCRLGEGGVVGEELQSPDLVGGVQPLEEQATEEPGEDRNGEEKAEPAGDPTLAIGRDAASRDDDVGMRMMGECRPPGVEHGGEPDAGAEVLGVGGDGDQGLGGGFEQQVIDDGLIVIGDVGDRPR